MYKDVIKPKVEVLLCQSFSLLGQDRTLYPDLQDLLKSVGISKGQEVRICAWKYLEPEVNPGAKSYFVPAILLEEIEKVAGGLDSIRVDSAVRMDPIKGLRAYNEIEQSAFFEWAAS